MKKLFSLVLVILLALGTLPTVSFAAVEDIIIEPGTTSNLGTGFIVNDISKFNDSKLALGYNNSYPIVMRANYAANTATYKPSITEAGLYEVFYWNTPNLNGQSETFTYGSNEKSVTMASNASFKIEAQGTKSTSHLIESIVEINPTKEAVGWISLGKHYFSATDKDCIKATMFDGEDGHSLYLGAMKFHKVTSSSDSNVGLERVYLSHAGSDWNYDTENVRNTAYHDNMLITFKGTNNYGALYALASDPEATVNVNWAGEAKGISAILTNQTAIYSGTPASYAIVVTAKDGTTKKTYYVSVEQENEASETKISVGDKGSTNGGVNISGGNWWASDGTAMYEGLTDTSKKPNVAVSSTFGETVSYAPGVTEATVGYYNVYAYNTATFNKHTTREVLATVMHNGMRDEVKIPFGGAVKGAWTLIGKYHFTGADGEKITLSNIKTDANQIANFSDVKIVRAEADPHFSREDVGAGAAVNGVSQSVSSSEFGNPIVLPAGDYTEVDFTYYGGEIVTSVTINGEQANKNEAVKVSGVNEGNNTVAIHRVVTADKEYTRDINVNLVKPSSGISAAVTATELTALPIDADSKGDSVYRVNAEEANTWTITGAKNKTCHIYLYKPALGEGFGNNNLNVVVSAGGEAYEPVAVDWSGESSQWIDLGTYDFGSTDNEVTLTAGANPILIDSEGIAMVATEFTPGIQSVKINNATYTNNADVEGKILSSDLGRGVITVTAKPSSSDIGITVNEEPLVNGEPIADRNYKPGLNKYEVVVKKGGTEIDRWSFYVNCRGMDYIADSAVQNGTWAEDGSKNGVTGGAVLTAEAGSLTYTVDSVVKGKAEIWAYVHKSDTATGTATLKIGETVLGTYNCSAVDNSGWVKMTEIPTYTFNGNESIVLEANGSVLADSVQLRFLDPVYSQSVLKIEEETGSVKAKVFIPGAYNGTGTLVLAKYNDAQYTSLADIKLFTNINSLNDWIETEALTGDGYYKAFLWSSASGLKPLVAPKAETIPAQ